MRRTVPMVARALALAAITGLSMPSWAAGIQQAFLVQNSGWMEPFYADPSSQLKPLVAAVAAAASSNEDTVYTLGFSQSNGANVSPQLLGKQQGAGSVAAQLAGLTVARKGAGPALADTDFQEAITKTITGPLASASGIIWIFTNNKNSPNNDAKTAERNRDFYRLLHLEPSIVKTLVFPLRMPVQGKLYSARGLMVYALAYGKPAADALDRIMAEGRLSKVLTIVPARLKPIDEGAVRIVPELVKDAPDVKVSLAADQRTVVLDVEAASLVPTVRMQASLQNLFYPYAIKSASVEAALVGPGGRTPVQVKPSTVTDLPPSGKEAVEVSFQLPMAQVPSAWSAQALSAMGKRVLLPLTVEMSLAGQKLALSDRFAEEMRDLFPGDPISEVFIPPDSIRGSLARVPLLLRIQYPLMPVVAAMGLLLLLVAGLLALGLMTQRTRRYEIVVNGARRNVALKAFTGLAIKDMDGKVVGEIRRGLGRPRVVAVTEGSTLSVGSR